MVVDLIFNDFVLLRGVVDIEIFDVYSPLLVIFVITQLVEFRLDEVWVTACQLLLDIVLLLTLFSDHSKLFRGMEYRSEGLLLGIEVSLVLEL